MCLQGVQGCVYVGTGCGGPSLHALLPLCFVSLVLGLPWRVVGFAFAPLLLLSPFSPSSTSAAAPHPPASRFLYHVCLIPLTSVFRLLLLWWILLLLRRRWWWRRPWGLLWPALVGGCCLLGVRGWVLVP